MTCVQISLAVLATAAVAALLLWRIPRVALITAMVGVLIAGLLSIGTGVAALAGSPSVAASTGAWLLPLGAPTLALDGLSAWFLLTIGILATSVSVYSVDYLGAGAARRGLPAFGALLCALLAALIIVVCAADAVVFLIGWEAMTLAAFFLIAFDHDRAEVRRGAWMYLIATHLGTALCVLPLFGLLTALAGTTAFAGFRAAGALAAPLTVAVMFLLGLIGFGTKAGIMPMHVWLPAAHPVAPTPVSALLSGVVVKTGIYGLLRLLTWLPPLPAGCAYVLLFVAAVTGVMGVLYALAQHDLKRLLAYHTVENIGIIALAIGMGVLGEATGHPGLAVLAYAGALLHVANHAIFKGLLFLSAGAVLHGTGTTDIERLGGLAKRTPVNAAMFLVGAVAICGLPPLNGFVGEWVIYGSLFGGAMHGVRASAAGPALGLVSLALMGGLALACFAKVFGVIFLGEPRDAEVHVHPTPGLMKIGMGVLAAACILIGVLPGWWVPLVERAAQTLVPTYAATGGTGALPEVLAPVGMLTWLALLLAALVAGLLWLRQHTLREIPGGAGAQRPAPATWGCGYARPTPRMQYTASSFVGVLMRSFRALLWPQRDCIAPVGIFPAGAHVATHAPDIAQEELFEPVFRAAGRLFAMVRTVSWSGQPGVPAVAPPPQRRAGPVRTILGALVFALRRGSIQVHLAFIVVTLVLVFLIETMSLPAGVRPEPDAAISTRVEP